MLIFFIKSILKYYYLINIHIIYTFQIQSWNDSIKKYEIRACKKRK